MHGTSSNLATIERPKWAGQPAEAVRTIDTCRVAYASRLDGLLRCVSSGYLSDGCSCQATIPTSVVRAAWARELELIGTREDRFFHFAWRGGVWFSFGLRDGRVRGVYCPEHSAARAERSFAQNVGLAS